MQVVADTNVIISGIFWKGPPFQILELWRDEKIQLVVSLEIIEEYERVSKLISDQYSSIDVTKILALIIKRSLLIDVPATQEKITVDPDDDKFMLCAEMSKAKIVISGDKVLLNVDGYKGIQVL